MQGASPATEQEVPLVAIVSEQQSLPVSPGTFPQPGPPQRPQATSQQTKFTVSSKPGKPLLQVLLDVTSAVGGGVQGRKGGRGGGGITWGEGIKWGERFDARIKTKQKCSASLYTWNHKLIPGTRSHPGSRECREPLRQRSTEFRWLRSSQSSTRCRSALARFHSLAHRKDRKLRRNRRSSPCPRNQKSRCCRCR